VTFAIAVYNAHIRLADNETVGIDRDENVPLETVEPSSGISILTVGFTEGAPTVSVNGVNMGSGSGLLFLSTSWTAKFMLTGVTPLQL
jgi:hypothetical protein